MNVKIVSVYCIRIIYDWQLATKSIPRIYDLCMTPVLHFTPYITNIMVQHEGRILPISTDSKNYPYQLYHFEIALLPNITP